MLEVSKKNVLLLYFYEFFSTFTLYYAIDTLFYLERGITASGYMLFVVISFLIQLVFELPSGIIADKYSKKSILIFSQFFYLISTIIFICSHDYFLFVIATVIAGLQKCFGTGIVNSLIYESLKNKENFNKHILIKNSIYYVSYMIAMTIGGFIAQKYGLIYTYYITLFPIIIGLLLLFFITDNEVDKSKLNPSKIEILKNGINEIRDNKLVKSLILTNGVMLAIIKLIEESHPDYSAHIGITEFQIGIYTSLILLFCILGNLVGSKIKSKDYLTIFRLNPLITGICILLLGLLNSKIGILFLLIMYIFSESFDIIMITKIHSSITSKSRVTIESIMSMIQCIIGIVLGLIISFLLKYISVNISYIILGLLLVLYGVYLNIILSLKNKKQKIL